MPAQQKSSSLTITLERNAFSEIHRSKSKKTRCYCRKDTYFQPKRSGRADIQVTNTQTDTNIHRMTTISSRCTRALRHATHCVPAGILRELDDVKEMMRKSEDQLVCVRAEIKSLLSKASLSQREQEQLQELKHEREVLTEEKKALREERKQLTDIWGSLLNSEGT